jgi:hypothetical protein
VNDALHLVRAIARHGLGDHDVEIAGAAVDDDTWAHLLRACYRQRLVGHLCAAVVSGVLPATDAQRREVTAWDLRALAHRERLDLLLLEAVEALTAAGIDHRVLKGSALAHTAYPRAQLRHHYDNDLLAPADRFDEAVAALQAAGYRRRSPPPRPGYDQRFAKSVTLISDDRVELDLHRTLIEGPFGFMVDLPALWARHESIQIAGAMLRCLAAEEQLLHACSSAALSDFPPRYSALRDVVGLLRSNRVDARRFVEVADAHRFGAVASCGIMLAVQGLGVADSHELITSAAAYEPSRTERRRLRVYRGRRSFAHQSLETLRVVPGLRNRVAYGYAVVWPSAPFLEAFETTRIGWLRRGERSLRGAHA